MNIEYPILGLIQGFTEPIPVSSSGHLKLFKAIFNLKNLNDLNFDIIVNFGSLLAIIFIFRKDLIKLIKSFFEYIFNKNRKSNYLNFKYCLLIIIATIPIGLIGYLTKDIIENKLGSMNFLAISFLITAMSLFLVRKIKGKKDDQDLTYKDAIIIGLFQILAIIPGISRSGMTLVGCLVRDLKRETSLKFIFLLYIPVSLATMLLGVLDIAKTGSLSKVFLPYSVGLLLSLLATLVSYKFLSNIVKKGKLIIFALYCLILSLSIFIFF